MTRLSQVLVVLLFALSVPCSVALGAGKKAGFNIKPVSVNKKNQELLELMVLGQRKELWKFGSKNVGFGAVLHSVARQGSCVPETHAICRYRYYLGLYEYGEYPQVQLFYLGEVGEIVAIHKDASYKKPANSDNEEEVLLQLTVANFPAHIKKRKLNKRQLIIIMKNARFDVKLK